MVFLMTLGTQCIMHVTYIHEGCVKRQFMLSVRLLVNGRLLVVKSGGVRSYMWILTAQRVSAINCHRPLGPHVVQGSTLL